MKRKYSVWVSMGSLICSFMLSGVVQAQSTFDISILAGSCANCHGTDGRSPGGIPSLAGRPESVLKSQMLAFKSQTPPPGTTIMNRLAKGYSVSEIDALAQYFARLSPSLPVVQKETR